jgi:hypothetical protein
MERLNQRTSQRTVHHLINPLSPKHLSQSTSISTMTTFTTSSTCSSTPAISITTCTTITTITTTISLSGLRQKKHQPFNPHSLKQPSHSATTSTTTSISTTTNDILNRLSLYSIISLIYPQLSSIRDSPNQLQRNLIPLRPNLRSRSTTINTSTNTSIPLLNPQSTFLNHSLICLKQHQHHQINPLSPQQHSHSTTISTITTFTTCSTSSSTLAISITTSTTVTTITTTISLNGHRQSKHQPIKVTLKPATRPQPTSLNSCTAHPRTLNAPFICKPTRHLKPS